MTVIQGRLSVAEAAVREDPVTSPERRPTPAATLSRETFTTSRLAEFCSQRELVAQTGHPVDDWPLVLVKELADNAIDIAEEIWRRAVGQHLGR
jgi:hypothetical protein